jgi:hypothetical protein
MTKFRLSRRSVLRGAGSIAIGLPWLECMEDAKAQDAPTTAQRFVAVYQPGGTVIDRWRPTGTETAPVLSSILSPLEPVKDKILIVDGLEMKSAVGEQHQAGIIALLTGTIQTASRSNYAGGPSIDQVLAKRISVGKPIGSMPVAIRWATGKSKGNLHPMNALNFEDNASFSPIPPSLRPDEIWTDLFGNLEPSTPGSDLLLQRKLSILDFVDKKYESLAMRMGARDRLKLQEHLEKIREIETSIATMNPTGMCTPPAVVDTSEYNPDAGLNADDADVDMEEIGTTDAAIPKVGRFMMDMIVMGLACNRTAVASLQWSDTEAKHTFPWLNLTQHHHFYQHDGGFAPNECEKICKWYSEMHLYLIQAMAAVDMGGHTLLDESVVFFGNELSDPPNHRKRDMPFMLAGNGGGLRTGRWVRHNAVSHNNLLVSIMNLFGDTRTTFGDPQYCTGALPGLT